MSTSPTRLYDIALLWTGLHGCHVIIVSSTPQTYPTPTTIICYDLLCHHIPTLAFGVGQFRIGLRPRIASVREIPRERRTGKNGSGSSTHRTGMGMRIGRNRRNLAKWWPSAMCYYMYHYYKYKQLWQCQQSCVRILALSFTLTIAPSSATRVSLGTSAQISGPMSEQQQVPRVGGLRWHAGG